MFSFCTLFDSSFLPYGLALYESLLEHCKEFHLYIFAFDDKSFRYLTNRQLDKVTVISLNKFEDEELLSVKKTRTKGEYCWTCASSTILYVLIKYNVDMCTYLDSDIFFFSDPSVLIDEMKEKSVLITEHRYSPKFDFTEKAGKYCVQFVSFKNNDAGRGVLEWWRKECIKWCYNRLEDGKYGDQKYLDDWPERFRGIVHVLGHPGGGVAPWNVQLYRLFKKNHSLWINEKSRGKAYPLVFFHFHNIKFDPSLSLIMEPLALSYYIPFIAYIFIYRKYFQKLSKIISEIKGQYRISSIRVYIIILLIRLKSLPSRALNKIKSKIGLIYGKNL